jgi:glycosyltransferase involved in cell wall biosynthesis
VRRILFLAYHFPPIGGAGVQRNAKFARYLPSFGYESILVTGPGRASDRWTPADQTMAAEVTTGTEVHRVPGHEPAESTGWRHRSERWLRLESRWSRWWIDGAVALGRRVGSDADLIYAGMAPYETAEAAARLARHLGKPWVADLQDPWALDEMMVFPTGLHLRREVARMRNLLASAAAVVMNTPEAAHRLCTRFPELRSHLVVSIPNGFDQSDFGGPPPRRTDSAFRIVHTGYLHTELGRRHRQTALARRLLGGSNGAVDILTRSHIYLLHALERLSELDSSVRSIIEVHLAGVISPSDREAGDASPFPRIHGYLPHHETVALMRSADLLFLPMHDLPPGKRMSIVPGKTYEYLASSRPILAAVPDGDARDLLVEAGSAFICRPPDVEEMTRIIAEQIERFRSGRPASVPNPTVLARFERRQLTQELTRVFDSVCASRATMSAGSRRGGLKHLAAHESTAP